MKLQSVSDALQQVVDGATPAALETETLDFKTRLRPGNLSMLKSIVQPTQISWCGLDLFQGWRSPMEECPA